MRKIFQTRNLTFLWLGQVISQSGDSIYQIALLWLALELSGSKSVTGIVAMSSYLPAMIFALFAGIVADRVSRRGVMLAADVFRALIVIGIPLAAFFDILSTPVLIINAFLLASAAAFFNPARDAIIPQLVPKDGLVRANSLIQTSWQLSMLIGPALAGLILHHVGIIHLFTFDTLAYLISFFFVLLIQRKRYIDYKPAIEKINQDHGKGIKLSDVFEGLRYTVKHPVLFPLLLITIADNLLIMGPAIVGTPVFVKEVLAKDASGYALIQACYAVGMLFGTAGLLAFGKKIKKGKILLVGMMLDGITFTPYFFVRTFEQMAIVTVIHAIAIPMLTVIRASIIQEIVPQKMTGQIFALVSLAVVGVSAVSSGITGMVLEVVPVPTLFFVIGNLACVCGIIGWLFASKLRNQA